MGAKKRGRDRSIDDVRRSTRFGRWLAGYTVPRLASDLGRSGFPVTDHAIYGWLAGRTAPRLEIAAALERISGGTVTAEVIRRHRIQVTFRRQSG